MRKTIRWISEIVQANPEKSRQDIIKEAETRFDLSPIECDFLDQNFSDVIKKEE
ncbi:MAG: hypothetical protein U9N60_10705 [Thermodesulfobacteriota bacterium]|nr:hypothetical protein [Thermodesulfobacteriota bacterium]